MASLYKRATPPQAHILRIVEGAVKNAADAHSANLPENFARSVAKRATGTLTSQWGEVLAAKSMPSEMANGTSCNAKSRANGATFRTPKASRSSDPLKANGRGLSQWLRRSPLPAIIKHISIEAGVASRAGQTERLETLIEVLRFVDKLKGP